MIQRQYLRDLSTWAGFLGIVWIIAGTIQAIAGVFFFVIGAVPGIIMIVSGVKLWNAKKCSSEYLETEDARVLNKSISNLALFFKIQGILVIVGLVFLVLSILLGGLTTFSIYYF